MRGLVLSWEVLGRGLESRAMFTPKTREPQRFSDFAGDLPISTQAGRPTKRSGGSPAVTLTTEVHLMGHRATVTAWDLLMGAQAKGERVPRQ